MKIVVDARPLATVGNGNARYLSGMLDAATKRRTDWHWHLIAPRPLHSAYTHIFDRSNVTVAAERSLPGPLWLHLSVPGILRGLQPDLFWSTLFLMPYNYARRCSIPSILNIHDMNPFVDPETMKGWIRVYMKQFMSRSIREADRVLCLSGTTRDDVLKYIPGVQADRLVVQYPGMIPPPPRRLRPETIPSDLKDYYLAVGTLEPRKNFDTLIHAYRKARLTNPRLKPLVIAGNPGWNMNETLRALQQGSFAEMGIHYAGAPTDAQLFWLYEHAKALFFPSLHEGFGLPSLEAAWFERPVYLSDIPIFREILPKAVFTAPRDLDGWAQRFLTLHRGTGKVVKIKKKEWTYDHRSVQLCAEFERTARLRH